MYIRINKNRQCMNNVTFSLVRVTVFTVEKQWLFLVCVFVALVIQHAKLLHRITLSCVACLALPYFSTLPHKWQNFRKKRFWFSLLLLSQTFLIIRRILRDMIIAHRSSRVSVILVMFSLNLNFFWKISKNTQITDFIKILLVEAELFHADNETDRHDEVNSHFSQLRLKMVLIYWQESLTCTTKHLSL